MWGCRSEWQGEGGPKSTLGPLSPQPPGNICEVSQADTLRKPGWWGSHKHICNGCDTKLLGNIFMNFSERGQVLMGAHTLAPRAPPGWKLQTC